MNDNSIQNILTKHNTSWIDSLEGLNANEVKRHQIIEKKIEEIGSKKTYLICTYFVTLIVVYIIVSVFYSPNNTFFNNLGIALLFSIVPPFPLAFYVIIPEWLKEKTIERLPEYKELQSLNIKIANHKRLQLSFWTSLSGIEFEREVARVFHESGYTVSLTKASGDGGIDILMQKDNQKIIVQCKAHNKSIGVPVIERLYGTLMHSGANKAILVSLNGFAKSADGYIIGKNIELLSLINILEMETRIQSKLAVNLKNN